MSFENPRGIGFEKEGMERVDNAIRVDGANPMFHNLHFWFSQFGGQRMDLSVDVADADVIQVNEREFANAGPGQRLNRPRANAAESNHAYMRQPQSPEAGCAEQPA